MGYAPGMFHMLLEFAKQNYLVPRARILELGAQEINSDVPTAAIREFCEYFNPGVKLPKRALSKFPGGPTGPMFELANFEYRSIDLFDGFRTIVLDLNSDELPDDMVGGFDFVTNIGTSEHIANQVQCFKIAHDALTVGGRMICQVPMAGYINHGLIKYEPKFFVALMRANNYKLILVSFTPPHRVGNETYPHYDRVINAAEWSEGDFPSGLITVLFEKREDQPFAPPVDADQRFVGDKWQVDFAPYF